MCDSNLHHHRQHCLALLCSVNSLTDHTKFVKGCCWTFEVCTKTVQNSFLYELIVHVDNTVSEYIFCRSQGVQSPALSYWTGNSETWVRFPAATDQFFVHQFYLDNWWTDKMCGYVFLMNLRWHYEQILHAWRNEAHLWELTDYSIQWI